jgi:phage-related protein
VKGRVLDATFYATSTGAEPVRDWLKSLEREDMRTIGQALLEVQLEWPIGMPQVRKMDHDLWESRTSVNEGEARVLFTVSGREMILLHGLIKKSGKTPLKDLKLARTRMKKARGWK